MRAILLTALGLGLLASATTAGPLQGEDGHARDALGLRISTLEGVADRTGAEQTELSRLRKALRKLEKYRGLDDRKDLRRVLKAVGHIEKSGTTDFYILASLDRMRRIFDSMANSYRIGTLRPFRRRRTDE